MTRAAEPSDGSRSSSKVQGLFADAAGVMMQTPATNPTNAKACDRRCGFIDKGTVTNSSTLLGYSDSQGVRSWSYREAPFALAFLQQCAILVLPRMKIPLIEIHEPRYKRANKAVATEQRIKPPP